MFQHQFVEILAKCRSVMLIMITDTINALLNKDKINFRHFSVLNQRFKFHVSRLVNR